MPPARSLGRFLADEVVIPLVLDLHIGLPDSLSRDRIALVHNWKRWETLLHLNVMPPGFVAASLNPVGLSARTIAVPKNVNAFDGAYNRADVQRVEIPSVNGHGNARSVARLYGAAATGGAEIGLRRDVRRPTGHTGAAQPGHQRQSDAHRRVLLTRHV
jgi:hypothetical protein